MYKINANISEPNSERHASLDHANISYYCQRNAL